MKTLLQINTVVNSGSTGRIVEGIGQLAIQNGWNSYIAYGRNERPSKSNLLKIGSNLDVKIHGLQTRLFDKHGLASSNATYKLINQIKAIHPDIVHLHNLHGYYINIEILFKYLAKADIPIVWTLHDCWPITGHCVHFDYINCIKWKAKCCHCPQTGTYPASFLIDRSKRNYLLKKGLFTSVKKMVIVPVSQWLGDIINQSFLCDYPVQVINNGIDIQTFKSNTNEIIREKYKIEGKFIILGVASIWSSRKGLADFIELSKSIDINSVIVLVGLNPRQIRNLPHNIVGINKTENTQELADLYSSADVFLNPTWEDNFPTTNLEALSCGTPVITYQTGGSIEAISMKTGIIVEKGDISGLQKAINNIRDNGKKHYSIACRERAKMLYDKNDRFLDYINLYNKLSNL